MQNGEPRASSSGLGFELHPLVLINISDHYTRTLANQLNPAPASSRVVGCLLGQQTGRVVDVSNSFEARHQEEDGRLLIDEAFLAKKLDQYKQTFPNLDIVGWYSTGSGIDTDDVTIHRKIMEMNESPVYLILDPSPTPGQKDLPVSLYETELHVMDGVPQSIFVQAKYTIQTSEAERIGVNQVAKVLPSGNDKATDQLSAHYATLQSATQILASRVGVLHDILAQIAAGELPYDHALVRDAASMVRRLPAMESNSFKIDFLQEYNDAMLTVLLSSMTKGCHMVNEVADKLNIAYDKSSRRRQLV